MTTDTAVRVTRMVVYDRGRQTTPDPMSINISETLTSSVPLEEIPYIDHPEIVINEHERTEMPFRYVKDSDGKPIMPKVSQWRLNTRTNSGQEPNVLTCYY